MNFFNEQIFSNYWFRTGAPSFLIDTVQRRNSMEGVLEPIVVNDTIFGGYDPANISETPLLFQTGYLTVKKMEQIEGRAQYTLGVPNSEVDEALLTCLLQAYGKYPDDRYVDKLRTTMQRQITDCDEPGFASSLEAMIATVPYDLHIPHEHYCHSLMLIWMRMLGFKIRAEEHNNLGRSDAVWEQPGFTVVVEIKYDAKKTINTLLDEAIKQIYDRRYYNKYSGEKLLLGIAFSGKNVGCRMDSISLPA